MPKKALVVPKRILLGDSPFQGFIRLNTRDLTSVIMKNFRYEPRGDALEADTSLKQVIPYIWILNPDTKKVFLYQRAKHDTPAGEHIETRYLGKYSGGVGGHIDEDTEQHSKDPITDAMLRELKEEVAMNNYPTPKFYGYLNDETDSIGTVHFGLIAIAETAEEVHAKAEEGLISGRFYDITEVDKLMNDPKAVFENWTRISWPDIRAYMLQRKS